MDNNYFKEEENLSRDLIELKGVFNTKALLNDQFNDANIKTYYKYTSWAYGLFHSKNGSVHMALNYDGVYNPDGDFNQAREIDPLINENSKVLELGCGKGINTIYLAEKNNTSQFYGIDISKEQLRRAKKKGKTHKNIHFDCGNFQQIPFEDNMFDVVFGIETLCYSDNLDALLKEVYRVLKKEGKFIVYDGYRVPDFNQKSERLIQSALLMERGVALNGFHSMSDWISVSKSNGFDLVINEDLSIATMPNLKRLYRASKRYLKNKFLAKLILFFLPSYTIKNAVTGITMPYTLMLKTHTYNKIVMTKSLS